MEDFSQVVQRVHAIVTSCLESGAELDGKLTKEVDSIYIKSVEGTILYANPSFDQHFGDRNSSLGRSAKSFLNGPLLATSELSDQMLLSGCNVIRFDHVGHDSAGREIRMRTHKLSMLGMGHPTMAVLGITRILEVITNSGAIRLNSLKDQWKLFSRLDDLDRAIAIGLGRGVSVSEIAEQQQVTKKTIENHRSAILRTLNLDSPVELIKLVVRLQENGFGDFGV